MNYPNKKYKKDQPDMLQSIVVGIFKVLWWLIKLPFGGIAKKQRVSNESLNHIRNKRSEIEGLLGSQNEIELKHAVMEADKVVDYAFRSYGYAGDTFADRLRSAEKYLDRYVYQSLWEGHKVRNQIAHETESRMSKDELKRAAKNLLTYINKI